MAGAVVTYFAVLCVPLGVAVAVLRYRLWDLDRLVSRTVTYAAVAAATLTAVALFAPLRRRVQDLVDRRFNRRDDAARTVDAFAARLRDQVDLDALAAELLAVVDQTVQPTRVSLWLKPPLTTRPASRSPAATEQAPPPR
jgi:hypothetical protein